MNPQERLRKKRLAKVALVFCLSLFIWLAPIDVLIGVIAIISLLGWAFLLIWSVETIFWS